MTNHTATSVLSLDIPGITEDRAREIAQAVRVYMADRCPEVVEGARHAMVPTGAGYPFRHLPGGDRTGRVSVTVRTGAPDALLGRVQAFVERVFPGVQYSSRIVKRAALEG